MTTPFCATPKVSRKSWFCAPPKVLALAILLLSQLFSASAVRALDLDAVNGADFSARSAQKSKDFDPALIKAQVLLDRAGFSLVRSMAAIVQTL